MNAEFHKTQDVYKTPFVLSIHGSTARFPGFYKTQDAILFKKFEKTPIRSCVLFDCRIKAWRGSQGQNEQARHTRQRLVFTTGNNPDAYNPAKEPRDGCRSTPVRH